MIKRVAIVFILLAGLAASGWVADRWLARSDRIRLDAERRHVWEVRDAILRFRLDQARFPQELIELVDGYLPASLIRCGPANDRAPQAPLLWDPTTGVLSWPGPFPIRGLIRHDQPLLLEVPAPPIRRDALTGEAIYSEAGDAIRPGPQEIVLEAEHFQFLSYGWEIRQAADAGGGAYIHLKEGRGDVDYSAKEVHPDRRAGDVYNVTGDNRPIEARCWFIVPETGTYYVWVRTMAHRSQCSNMINMNFNGRAQTVVGHNGSTPYVWLWHRTPPVHLMHGPNYAGFRVYQDDVKVDQVLLTPTNSAPPPGSRTYIGLDPPTSITGTESPPAVLSLTCDALAIGATNDPSVEIYVLNNRLDLERSSLELTLDLPGGRTRRRLLPLLAADHRLLRFPYDLQLPRPLDKREYLLRCRLLHENKLVQERTLVLYRGYDWRILGPLPYMQVSETAAPESVEIPQNPCEIRSMVTAWSRYDEANTDPFALMDFGKMFSGRTYNAMPEASAYAYTEVSAAAAGTYLLKGMGDDNLIVWINGDKVMTITEEGTAIRTALDKPVMLRKGLNRILYRINQWQGQWQAGLRIRTLDDRPADVRGIAYTNQSVSAWDDAVAPTTGPRPARGGAATQIRTSHGRPRMPTGSRIGS
ncbi:MAG: hypothetical protein O2923_10125 [Verrucomicrobia bacterium]|nr:hypothetical protein [Verrucomicrobiota bacterium]MDA1086314.1 hypothetical protein [Verrucomicrobiota bacterium]